MAKETKGKEVSIMALNKQKLKIRIKGTSPLICNQFSESQQDAILSKQMKKAKVGKVAKDPEKQYKESLYQMEDGRYGFPCSGFKKSMVRAAKVSAIMPMTDARGAFHVIGTLAPIKGTPRKRKDTVRLATGVADIRFRGEFPEWESELYITYNANAISDEQLAQLINVAGFAVGIGDWRPEKNGSFGMFELA